jgi:predicted aspartyl protease
MREPRVFVRVALFLTALCVAPWFSWGQAKGVVSKDNADLEAKEFRLDDLEARLRTMPPGEERDYFAGVLANRAGHLPESIDLLNRALGSIRTSRPNRAVIALQVLADDYMKSFQYAAAAGAYDDLLAHFSGQLKPGELQSARNDAGIAQLLREAPPQTIAWDGAAKLKTERNPLNSVNVELTVNGVTGPWLLDTGANLSLVTRSFAERLGLKLLPGVAQTKAGLTGIENPLRVALLPTLQMGGATLHNVVLMVLDDANLYINLGKSAYQILGIIGYPVFQALGAITFLHEGEFVAGDRQQPQEAGARMYMNGLSPVIECRVEGKALPFYFDTGAAGTNFFVRYHRQFRSESKTWKKGKEKDAGAGGVRKRKIYIQPQVDLGIGDKTVTLRKVSIYRTSTGSDDNDELYGNLGQDVVANFKSFTLDFSTMTFSLGEPLAPDQPRSNP